VGTSILGEIYNAGTNCKSKKEREAPYAVDGRHKSVTGLSLNDLNQLVKDGEKWRTLVYNIIRK
jgi:hypothetical protein